MIRLLPLACLLLILLGPPARANRYVTYLVREHDTPESIAAEYYGNRARAPFIIEFNSLPPGARLKPGQVLRIPTSYRYRLTPNETIQDVAQRLVGDRRRAPLLLELSGLKPTQPVAPGTEIQVPFHFIRVVLPGDTLVSIARRYYGDPTQARLIAAYNFRKSPHQPLSPGERLVVPITHVRVRAVHLPRPALRRPTPPPGAPRPPPEPEPDSQRLEAELAEQVRARLQEAEASYREGNYIEVPSTLIKLLAEVDPSEAQLVEIYRLLACSYVALGETELAVRALREVLDRRPDFQFDPVMTSPKIRAALDRARSGS
ncbi:MAG: LysM peptidoglycan-binding domain-containing protein [Myxococcales bacterium]|nr:LysM peptidoglycan-binding domain-containing protein [Myxococcota bacterium]MDW8281476.1 LysM peptidoglycan-binding domain-containing protein [Myxococcales bacterium]